MPPRGIAPYELLEQGPDVVQQRVLPLVDEQTGRGVQRLQMNRAVSDAALAYDLVDPVGGIDQLELLVRNPVDDTHESLDTRHAGRLLRFDRIGFHGLGF